MPTWETIELIFDFEKFDDDVLRSKNNFQSEKIMTYPESVH